MFGGFVATHKSKEDLRPDLREVAREISLKTQVYVTPTELHEITEFIPDPDGEEAELILDDFDINDDDASRNSKERLDVVEESYFYFYAQANTTTVLCQVVMDTDEHVKYNVKKIEW